jgi:hypothetical protein
MGGNAALVDAEHAFEPVYAKVRRHTAVRVPLLSREWESRDCWTKGAYACRTLPIRAVMDATTSYEMIVWCGLSIMFSAAVSSHDITVGAAKGCAST